MSTMEMETALLSSNNMSLFSLFLILLEDQPYVTQPALNVNLEDNVLHVKLVMLLILLQSNAFIVTDVLHATDRTLLNVPPVFTLNSSTQLLRLVLM